MKEANRWPRSLSNVKNVGRSTREKRRIAQNAVIQLPVTDLSAGLVMLF